MSGVPQKAFRCFSPQSDRAPASTKPCKQKGAHKRITPQQSKLLAGLSSGMSISEAGRHAGYSFPQASNRAYRILQQKVPELLEGLGFPIEVVLKKVAGKMEAKETKFFAHQGIVLDTREVDAHGVQLEAAQTLGRWCGLDGKAQSDDAGDGEPSVRIALSLLLSDEAGKILDVE